jgi:amidophosphoribosyltransferase
MSVEEMRDYVGATSLAFLSVDGTYRALGFERRDNNFPQFTDHCFTGDYPTELADQTGSAHTGQLSFLSEVR